MAGAQRLVRNALFATMLAANAVAFGNPKMPVREAPKNPITVYCQGQMPKAEANAANIESYARTMGEKKTPSDSVLRRIIYSEAAEMGLSTAEILAIQDECSRIMHRGDSLLLRKHKDPSSLPLSKLCKIASKIMWKGFECREGVFLYQGLAAGKKYLDPANSMYVLAGLLSPYGVESKIVPLPNGQMALHCFTGKDSLYLKTTLKGNLTVYRTRKAFEGDNPVSYGEYDFGCPLLTYLALGNTKYYLAAPSYGDAIAYYTKSIALGKELVPAIYNRGCCYFYKGDYGLAIADFDALMQRDSTDAQACYMRGLCKGGSEDYAGAAKDFARLLELDKDNSAAHDKLGDCHYYLGDYGKAVEYLDEALDLYGDRLRKLNRGKKAYRDKGTVGAIKAIRLIMLDISGERKIAQAALEEKQELEKKEDAEKKDGEEGDKKTDEKEKDGNK